MTHSIHPMNEMISAIIVHVRKSVLNLPTKISRANIHAPIAKIRNMTMPTVLGIDAFRLA
ncbi:hypothetical protein [Bifidobacterium longum]|uniref:hypothetical protein n=1 Tax=Bifidobacterium longum TaxID=216816 RepID=UPI003DA387EC